MKRSFKWLFVFTVLFACKTKQWNLNKTIGWGEHKDFSVLLIKWQDTTLNKDSSYTTRKRELEDSVLKVLKSSKLGEGAESDSGDTHMLFIVPQDYKQSLNLIIEVIKKEGLEGKLEIYKRNYVDYNKWMDKVVYP